MNFKNIITYLILVTYALVMFYLSWFYWILEYIVSLCIYTCLFYFLHYLWTKIRKTQIMYFKDFVNHFLNRISIILLIITTIIWWLAYLYNEIIPAPMPEYTISDWKKEVKFQAMSHIWTKNFYDQVVKNLTDYKRKWWVYFFEWVKPGTVENWVKFDKAIWMNFDKNLYKNFSKLYWVTNQDNSIFLWLVNDLDFNVDLNMDEIVTKYEEKINSKPAWVKEFKSKLPIDANKIIIDTLSKLNSRQLKVLVYTNQAILNFIIWSEATQSFLTDNFTNKDLFDVILWKRNEVLSKAIIESKYNNIYITYWLLHFNWVFELLKKDNPKWHIVSQNNLYPIKN
jgi:hypothetical protein